MHAGMINVVRWPWIVIVKGGIKTWSGMPSLPKSDYGWFPHHMTCDPCDASLLNRFYHWQCIICKNFFHPSRPLQLLTCSRKELLGLPYSWYTIPCYLSMHFALLTLISCWIGPISFAGSWNERFRRESGRALCVSRASRSFRAKGHDRTRNLEWRWEIYLRMLYFRLGMDSKYLV